MPKFVALLRGINVGKGKRIAMADLRSLLERLGYTGVSTLLNSGNAIFTSSGRAGSTKHAAVIREALRNELELDVAVIVKSASELETVIAENALADPGIDGSRLLAAIGPDRAAIDGLAGIEALVEPPERFLRASHAAYFHCPAGILQSKAGEALLGKAGRGVTTRNWSTVLRIAASLRDR